MREEAERAKEEMERRLFQLQDEARMANEALVRVLLSFKITLFSLPACNICPQSPSSIKVCGPDVNLRWIAELLRCKPLSWTHIRIPFMLWLRLPELIGLPLCSCAPRRRPTFWRRKPRSQRRRPNYWPTKQLRQNRTGRGWRSQHLKPKKRRDWWSRRWEKQNNWRLSLLSNQRGGGPLQ